MTRTDWARNKSWTPLIEKAFYEKLKRAHNKQGYLRLQAFALVESRPDVSLRLADEFLQLGRDHPELARILEDRGRALWALGSLEEAVSSFRDAITRQNQFPGITTHAYVRLPMLIACERMEPHYTEALSLLETNKHRPLFPKEFYWWHGSMALVLEERGKCKLAEEHARKALEAAEKIDSGASYHRQVGLVSSQDRSTDFHRRLECIVQA